MACPIRCWPPAVRISAGRSRPRYSRASKLANSPFVTLNYSVSPRPLRSLRTYSPLRGFICPNCRDDNSARRKHRRKVPDRGALRGMDCFRFSSCDCTKDHPPSVSQPDISLQDLSHNRTWVWSPRTRRNPASLLDNVLRSKGLRHHAMAYFDPCSWMRISQGFVALARC